MMSRLCDWLRPTLLSQLKGAGKRRSSTTAASPQWITSVGLEIHAQIKSESKAFAPSRTGFAAPTNSNVDFVDAGFPGTLPVLNRRCVEAGLLTSLALGCHINRRSLFDRKHYFYADMPTGYQITQQRIPLAERGILEIGDETSSKRIRIQRLHLEHDSGKSIHTISDIYTLIDLNRSGVGLMEIVTEPDIQSGEDAAEFVHQMLLILEAIATCDGNLAEGSLRVDANVSVRPATTEVLGNRCEVKNINGMRFLSKAIEFERERQIQLLTNGLTVEPETRNFDVATSTTVRIRGKEGEKDYRYMPEPDLPPLFISDETIQTVKNSLPILPREKAIALCKGYNLSLSDAWTLVLEPGARDFFVKVTEALHQRLHHAAFNWITSELFGLLKAKGQNIKSCDIIAAHLAELIKRVDEDVLSGLQAKRVLALMVDADERTPTQIANDLGLVQISDSDSVKDICLQVLDSNPTEVAKYGASEGDRKKLNKFFVGQAMKLSKGRANPKLVQQKFKEILEKS